MKKGVFFLLLAAMMMPFMANAQVNSSVHIDNTVSACVSYTWNVTGETLTTSGVYTQVSGDTLFILDLTINPVYNITISSPVHGGCTYSWGDTVITNSGVYTKTFESVSGCDSTVTITLTLDTVAYRNYSVVNCGEYTWKGTTYTTSGLYAHDSLYNNCDSVLTLNLTVIDPYAVSADTTFFGCTKVSVPGYSRPFYRDSTIAKQYHFRTISKCYDSTMYVHVIVRNNVYNTEIVRACDSYTLTVNDNERVYTYSKVDSIKVGKASNGCDSIYVLNLTVNHSPEVYISGDLRVTPGSNAVLHANSDQNVQYKWFNGDTRDSIVLTGVQANTDVYVTGTNNSTNCSHTAYVTVMCNVAINDVEGSQITVYPNPTKGIVNVASDSKVKNLSVYNIAGQCVMNTEKASVDMRSLNDGTYVIRIELENGNVATQTVILNK